MSAELHHIIELHDTKMVGLIEVGTQMILFLRAYIHQSEGRPGWDAGSGWVQAVALTFTEGSLEGELPELPADIWEGSLIMADNVLRNYIPLPFIYRGDVALRIRLDNPADIVITGKQAVLTRIGEAVYVEEFTGTGKE